VGNLTSLTDANGHTTKWSYTDRNQVQTKTYADTTACTYAYDAAGHLQTRLDQLGRTTTYGYNAYNLVSTVSYPTDAQVVFIYDQQGRRLTMTDGSGTTTWTYDAAGRTASETQARSNRIVNYGYDSFSNRTGLLVQSTDGSEPDWSTTYGYDNSSRLSSVLDARLPNSQPYQYSYNGNANLVGKVTSPSGLTTLKTYDNLGRLLSISAQASNNSPINSFTYAYDPVGQRTSETALDHQRGFSYDAQRQLIQSTTTANGVQTAMPQYTYDGIGNRLTSALNDSNGAQSSAYTPNSVNQYTSITGALADAPAYDANGNTVSCANALGSLSGGSGQSGETLSYDEENRLIGISDAAHQSVFVYDGLGRRVERQEYLGAAQTAVIHYVYDGRNVIEDLDSNYSTLRSYTRGLDLSGSFTGAGGIGGLLALNSPNGSRMTASYFYDGNGNVTDLVSDGGANAAHYVYSPFGYRVSATGALADVNPYQFSSKERDSFTGFYYYGLRYYNPEEGRWLNRDPLGENGSPHLYCYVANEPSGALDPYGLKLKAYSGNPADIPLTPDPLPPEDAYELGEAGIHWYVNIVPIDETVIITGNLSFTPHVYPMDKLFPDHRDDTGRTTEEHEHNHDQMAKDEWNNGIQFLNRLEGTYCSTECANKAAELASKINDVLRARQLIKQLSFDLDAYGRLPNGYYSNLGQKALSDLGAAGNRLENRLNEERALFKEFMDMKCQKK
jgi:RHS repeat-associated protein